MIGIDRKFEVRFNALAHVYLEDEESSRSGNIVIDTKHKSLNKTVHHSASRIKHTRVCKQALPEGEQQDVGRM